MTDRPFALPADSAEVVLDLPFPPSVNRTRRVDGKGMRILKGWHENCDVLMMSRRDWRRLPKITGAYEATIVLSRKHGRNDLDNSVKGLLDYAVRIEIVPDDGPKFLRRLIVEWGHAPEGARITLRSLHGEN